MNKYEKILVKTWEDLENNFKGSEITLELWGKAIELECDTQNCLKNCIRLMWNTWYWFDDSVKEYYKVYIKSRYGVIVK